MTRNSGKYRMSEKDSTFFKKINNKKKGTIFFGHSVFRQIQIYIKCDLRFSQQ